MSQITDASRTPDAAPVDATPSDDAATFAHHYGITPTGNAVDPHGELVGKNVLHALHDVASTAKHVGKTTAATDALLVDIDLDATHELPKAPWFVDTHWSVRRTLLHIIAETTQHAGHADIIRESLDGQKSMG